MPGVSALGSSTSRVKPANCIFGGVVRTRPWVVWQWLNGSPLVNLLARAGHAPQLVVEVCMHGRKIFFSALIGFAIFAAGYWAGGTLHGQAGAGLAIAATPPAPGVSKTVLFEAARS